MSTYLFAPRVLINFVYCGPQPQVNALLANLLPIS